MHKFNDNVYDVKETYTVQPINELQLSVSVNKYTNEFDVDFKLDYSNIYLMNNINLKSCDYEFSTYNSAKLSIINQLQIPKYDNNLIFNRELVLDTIKHKGKISKNSVNILLFKLEENLYLLSVERTFINSVEPFKQSVSFHWTVNTNVEKSKSSVRKYSFNHKHKYKLINPNIRRK